MLFSGGEPLLRKDAFRLFKEAKEYEMHVTVNTNATLITNDIAKKLKDSRVDMITVNIEGDNPQTHDEIRGVEGAFNATIKGIHNLLNEEILLQVFTVATKKNVYQLPGIVTLIYNLGIRLFKIIGLIPAGRALAIFNEYCLSLKEWRWLFSFINKQRQDIPDIDIGIQHGFPFLVNEYEFVYCLAGKLACVIASDGFVYPCPTLRLKDLIAGNVLSQRFSEIWENSSILNFYRNYMPKHVNECYKCKLIEVCRGGCRTWAYSFTGSIEEIDPRCRLFRRRLKNVKI